MKTDDTWTFRVREKKTYFPEPHLKNINKQEATNSIATGTMNAIFCPLVRDKQRSISAADMHVGSIIEALILILVQAGHQPNCSWIWTGLLRIKERGAKEWTADGMLRMVDQRRTVWEDSSEERFELSCSIVSPLPCDKCGSNGPLPDGQTG